MSVDLFRALDRLFIVKNDDARQEILKYVIIEAGKLNAQICELQKENLALKQRLNTVIDTLKLDIPGSKIEEGK